MTIVILGWGSLIWDPRKLPREGTWAEGGPVLPIEYSRISHDARLTLVIDPIHGQDVPTRYVLSPRADLQDTISDLKLREGTETNKIGFVDVPRRKTRTIHADIGNRIGDWARARGFEGVVWTDLPSNFETENDHPFSLKSAERYLRSLPKNVADRARKYINNAPPEVDTPLRRRLKENGWLDSAE